MSTTLHQQAVSIAPASETVFTMRVVLPLDGNRTGIRRMVHACADIITHLGDNGIAESRKRYLKDPDDFTDVTPAVIGEWSLGPDPEPQGTAAYAFNAREIAGMLHALRIMQEIRLTARQEQSPVILQGCYHEEVNAATMGSTRNACDHFYHDDLVPLDDDEIDALCERINPLDAITR